MSVIENKNTFCKSTATPPPSHVQSLLKQALPVLLLGNNIGKRGRGGVKDENCRKTNYT